MAEYEAGLPNYNRFKQADLEHPIEKVGKELRAKMVWLQDRPRKRAALPTRFARFPMNSSTHRSAPPNGARWLTQALEAEGVGTLFGYPVAPSCRSTTRWWIRR